ncbi:nucleoside deaminase [Nocardiopsis dassonvillei]|uniref:CMP/dCMP deaminase zinc-binding protein n=1 Tax=Nocardiopsis dassonvillei (strain ATCC 23218 / DSM 43111 / CIP 107115 / JCM 7437 / KCTC 9190 / NBRC 14626 / NCTC 10488 / NRRL B-5397 / IMRU 509) TaxID=446468 RepID=D7B403_NOCDD|nr:nucleoside deaminase [Nocardiopsis dassonvillei]ADH66964.1 CMP/dCMP deaminase zinc-binding protein [Nocardiopsis dassonvillei subsp. dassonvillei DSM 43111]NKY80334.1 nucleoside deaminase [Nocardiopsis dassonvillei]VEI86758.1 Guanine deaminase [Nocardiopsis dassonvillei]
MLSETDMRHLRRAVDLAEESLEAGDEPFGSVLVSGEGAVLFEDRNRVAGGDPTQHPEFAIARWTTTRVSPGERAAATVYTSGEHCPMCSAAHGWAGLGRIVYASSSAQLVSWLEEWGVPPAPVRPLPVGEIVPGIAVEGPVDSLVTRVRSLQARFHGRD